MFLKVWVFTILVSTSGVFGLSGFEMNQTVLAMKGGVRDSKCSDRFYSDCFPRRPFLELNVDFEVCHYICQSNQEPTCDWFTYDTQEFNKCQMFSNELGTMEDFFKSCGQTGGPTRHHDGTCMVLSAPLFASWAAKAATLPPFPARISMK